MNPISNQFIKTTELLKEVSAITKEGKEIRMEDVATVLGKQNQVIQIYQAVIGQLLDEKDKLIGELYAKQSIHSSVH